ncbi:MAG: ABC transporter permease [Acidobacteria bacterium]|nr:ABC transporter permease [Acidobacteriota bacterium]
MNSSTTITAQFSTPNRTRMIATAFLQLLWRDLWVTLRTWQTFLAMTLVQPIFFLFIFGRLLPMLGQANAGYGVLFLPGIISLTTVLTAMQAVSMPLVIEFGYTKEIEDRLLSPMPVWMVGIQKMVFASIRGLIAGAMIVPLGRLILGSGFSISFEYWWLLIIVAVLASLVGAGLGLTLGTFVQPSQIGLMFSVILTPMLFTGCIYFPWAMLDKLRWFQVVTCINPITYASEGFRASLVPNIPHARLVHHRRTIRFPVIVHLSGCQGISSQGARLQSLIHLAKGRRCLA